MYLKKIYIWRSSDREAIREEAREINAFWDVVIANITKKSEYSWKVSKVEQRIAGFCFWTLVLAGRERIPFLLSFYVCP